MAVPLTQKKKKSEAHIARCTKRSQTATQAAALHIL